MMKKYKASMLTKIFSLGLKQYGYKIDDGTLIVVSFIPKHISIESIEKISFEWRNVENTITYYYIITDKNGKDFQLSYSTLDGNTYQELFREILEINPTIFLTASMKDFLASEITDKVLKFDFKVHKGEFFKRNKELTQKHPSLSSFIGFTIVFVFLPIPFVFGGVGNNILTDTYGTDYEWYRLWAIIISGIALMIALTNLFISLVSMYLGHKLTIISITVAVIGVFIGIII